MITWPNRIDEAILQRMTQFIQLIQQNENGIADIHHAYHEVLIQYKKKIVDFPNLKTSLQDALFNLKKPKSTKTTLWTIPVCYDEKVAIDLAAYLEKKELTKDQLIRLHTSTIYTVYFTGFLPGFLYLGGLDNALSIDRKSKPSRLIKKGTVAIGGSQTGVYPQDSPGGWYGIGYTPIPYFDANKEVPTWAKTGDKIQFESVSEKETQSIQKKLEEKRYTLKATPYEG